MNDLCICSLFILTSVSMHTKRTHWCKPMYSIGCCDYIITLNNGKKRETGCRRNYE